MAELHLMTVFGGMLAVPCVIVFTQGGDKTTNIFAGVCTAVGLWLGLYRYVGFLDRLTTPALVDVLAILALVLSIVITVRLKHQILGTLLITAGVLTTALALGIVGT